MVKYKELAYDLFTNGFNVVLFDLRGHGGSSDTIGKEQLVHVSSYQDYIKDLKAALSLVPKGPTGILAHSLGAAIASAYLINDQNRFMAAGLITPMMSHAGSPVPEWMARATLNILTLVGLEQMVVPGHREVMALSEWTFSKALTSSESRFNAIMKDIGKLPIKYFKAGSSVGFARESYKIQDYIMDPDHGKLISVPVLIIEPAKTALFLVKRKKRFVIIYQNAS